jgi:hypothetical protein
LPAASKVSASPVAGSTNRANSPSSTARVIVVRRMDPPELSASRSLGRDRKGVFRPMSKDRRTSFSIRSKALGRPVQ